MKKRDVCDMSVSRFTSTWERGSERKGQEEKGKRETARDRDRERQERQHVRPTSVESDETLLDSAPGISRGNGGLILRRKFLTSRTFEPGRGEAFKVLSSRRFPDARVETARDGGISRTLDIDQPVRRSIKRLTLFNTLPKVKEVLV